MSYLGLMQNTADIAQTTPDLSALPSTHGERAGAAWDAAQSPDRYWNVQAARKERADKIIDDLHAMTGERLKNPFDNSPTQDEIRENLGQPTTAIYARRLEKLREKTRNAKAGLEQFGGLPQDYLDVDSIDASIASESGGRRARDERMSGTGGGLGGFLGSAAGEMFSPVGIATSFIPVTRMPLAIAEATIAGFARNVAKEALFQGTTQGVAQGLSTIVDYQTRKQFGTEQTNEQILEEILSATGGGAILGGAFRATHLGILKLASRGVEIPPAVIDSARVMEEAYLYGNKSPLRINPAQNEVATDQATAAAALGRAASPDVDVGVPNLHEAARRLDPALMQRYDAAVAWRDEARAILSPTDETIAMLKKRMDDADAAIAAAGPSTQAQADTLGNRARMAREIYEDAVERKTALDAQGGPSVAEAEAMVRMWSRTDTVVPEHIRAMNLADAERALAAARAGAPEVPETTVSTSLRQQAAMADLELRELIPEINKLMTRAGEEVTAGQRAADAFFEGADEAAAFARVEARLSPEDISRVRELQDMIPEYEKMRDAATPEDKAAWQTAIDDFNTEIAKIMDLDIADQATVKAAMKAVQEHPSNPMQAPRPTPETPPPAAPKAPGESAEDKTVLRQAQAVIDSETITRIDPEARRKMELIDIEEREYKAAISCVVGVM